MSVRRLLGAGFSVYASCQDYELHCSHLVCSSSFCPLELSVTERESKSPFRKVSLFSYGCQFGFTYFVVMLLSVHVFRLIMSWLSSAGLSFFFFNP